MDNLIRKYKFKILIGGIASAGFTSCTGLSVSSTYSSIREAGALAPTLMFEGYDFKPLVLTKGITLYDSEAFFWWETASKMHTPANLLFSRNIIIQEYSSKDYDIDGKKQRPLSYVVFGARIKFVDFGSLNAEDDGETILTQRLEIVHCGIDRIRL